MNAYINIDVNINGKQFDQTKRFTAYTVEAASQRAVIEREVKEMIDNIFRQNNGARNEK